MLHSETKVVMVRMVFYVLVAIFIMKTLFDV